MTQYLLGIDVGGTFTDLVLSNGRALRVAKVQTTPADPCVGIAAGMRALGLPLGDSNIALVFGSTVATNTLLERRGDRVALITTRGHEDMLEIGRQDRPDLYALHVERPAPLVRPDDCHGVDERVAADGQVLTPLTDEHMEQLLARVCETGVQSVAVCLLFSYLRPDHERRIARRAAERGLAAFASCDILPEYREYERASTTVVNAFVAGRMAKSIARLHDVAREHGIRSVSVMQSNGGRIGPRAAAQHAVRTILSGPAGGIVAAADVAKALGLSKVVTYDMGGTSTDVALWDGALPVRTDTVCGGVPIGVPMLGIHTVGAGGGSIAHLDAGGALRVGPESAGAVPGPACYGIGELPTISDANVLLGRLRPEHFMGGAVPLHAERSFAAFERLGKQMGCSARAAAGAAIEVCEATMEHAIGVVCAARGHDPAECVLICYGGAGGLHACALAESLGMAGVIMPAQAGLFSALGLMGSDIVLDFSRGIPVGDDSIDLKQLRHAYAELLDEAAKAVLQEGFDIDDSESERLLDMRYAGQSYEITVPVRSLTDVDRLTAPFHELHAKRHGFSWRERPVEAVTARLRTRIDNGLRAGAGSAARMQEESPTPEHAETYETVMLDEPMSIPVIRRNHGSLRDGRDGPMLIVENHTTLLIPAQWTATVRQGHVVVRRDNGQNKESGRV